MRAIAIVAVLAAGIVVTSNAYAAGEEELAQKAGCATCHAMDTKKKGPSYKDIAAKYKGKADAEKTLVTTLNEGKTFDDGKKHPKSKGTPEDNAALVKWILAM